MHSMGIWYQYLILCERVFLMCLCSKINKIYAAKGMSYEKPVQITKVKPSSYKVKNGKTIKGIKYSSH